jgi:hypothetical protein
MSGGTPIRCVTVWCHRWALSLAGRFWQKESKRTILCAVCRAGGTLRAGSCRTKGQKEQKKAYAADRTRDLMFTKHTHYHCATRVLEGWLGLLVGWLVVEGTRKTLPGGTLR